MIRNDSLRKDKPALGIIDAKSIKNTDIAEEKGYDAGKNVSGIKLHIIRLLSKLRNYSGPTKKYLYQYEVSKEVYC